MLLYGPPGTGKSTIARKLARKLGFELITVTPSDFIATGGEAVEARANAIFRVLEEQRDAVVLFDEIA
ncbi:MAG TPA: AAA family ATPase [Gaiellaceae bacterium]|nr:AAA family ATPase [Gaiellaceae bacterium]